MSSGNFTVDYRLLIHCNISFYDYVYKDKPGSLYELRLYTRAKNIF